MKYSNCSMSSSLFSSFQKNTKCESRFFADTCTCRVPIFNTFNTFALKSSGSEFLERMKTPFYVWYVKGNRCLLFILYSGMGNLSDESCKTCKCSLTSLFDVIMQLFNIVLHSLIIQFIHSN